MTLLHTVMSISSLQVAVTYLRMPDTEKERKKSCFLRRHNKCIVLHNAMS
jgi:hypothetical protein